MPEYKVILTRAARGGLAALGKTEREQVVKQLEKLKRAPELGAPLGNKLGTELAGCRKLYACKKRVRIIYEIQGLKLLVEVIAIGPRENAKVYRIAASEQTRRRRLRRVPSPETGDLPTVLRPPS